MVFVIFLILISVLHLSDFTSGEVDINSTRILQGIYSLAMFAIPALLIAFLYEKNLFKYTCLNQSAKFQSYITAILLVFISIPIVNVLAKLNSQMVLPHFLDSLQQTMKQMEDKAAVLTTKLLSVNTVNQFFLNLLIIALIPAIGEELLFRSILQKHIVEWTKNIHLGIFITAFVFSAFHMQFFTFLPRLFLGLMLGYMFQWSKSLWLPILAHFINNAMAVFVYYFATVKSLPIDSKIDSFGTDAHSILYVIFSLGLFVFAMYKIYNYEKNKIVSVKN